MARLAQASTSYPVTPGDVYQLRFQNSAGGPEEVTISVQSDSTATVGFLGTYDGRGLTFAEFRRQVLRDFREAYPNSIPELSVVAVGHFYVTVRGNPIVAGRHLAWGLTPLTEIVSKVGFGNVDTRDVVILRRGTRVSVDLQREVSGPESAPVTLLRPDDTIVFSRPRHQISIRGAVPRPGDYQVLPGETVNEVVDVFAGGLLETAAREAIHVRGTEAAIEDRLVSVETLRELDSLNVNEVYIPDERDRQPFVFLEGAISPAERSSEDLDGFEYVQRRVRWYPDETVGSLIERYRTWLSPNADLENIAIRRSESGRTVATATETRLRTLSAIGSNEKLRPGDRVMIPFRRPQVIVSGAVENPGQYGFVPNQSFDYYLRLAGGIDGERRIGRNPRITGTNGERRPDTAVIEPGDTIHFTNNHPWYHIGPVFTVASTVLSTLALALSLAN